MHREATPRARRKPLISAHELPLPIQWHEGMLLAPQHFQQLSLRQEQLLHYRNGLTSPFCWGVRHLKIDPVQLVDGTFRILEIEAVMPDGLVFSRFGEETTDLTVELTEHSEEMKDRPLTVHLAVAAQRPGSSSLDSELARYESAPGEAIADPTSGAAEVRIPRLRPRLRLLIQDDPPQKFVSIPLARIVYAQETFSLTHFVPPTLRVSVGSPLGEMCSEVARRLREKAVFLADQVNSPSLAARGPQLLETKSTLNALVSELPRLEGLLFTGVAHPYELFLALCSVLGRVAAVGTALVPPVLESYDQNDPYASLDQARRFIFQAIEEGVSESYTAYPFILEKDSFLLDFDPAWIGRRLVLGVRSRRGSVEGGADAWIENALIGSRSKMASLRERRIIGAERKATDALRDLIPSRGTQLYLLNPDPEFIVPGETLILRNLDDLRGLLRPAEVLLYVRNSGVVQ